MKTRVALIGAGIVALIGTVAVVSTVASDGSREPKVSNSPPPTPRPLPPVAAGTAAPPKDDYERAIDAAHARGIRVWIETDLVKRWLEGDESFYKAVARVGELAKRPGVAGINIADELGYNDGLNSATQVQQFLTDAAAALKNAAPGRPVLVDLIVPELGCLPGDDLPDAKQCAAKQRASYPQLALSAVDGYLGSHAVDVVNLSTSLQPDSTYASWGTNRDTAQSAAWQEAQRRGWGRMVRLQSRRALAHTGVYTRTDTAALLTTFIEIPRQNGAAAVDIWTWRQQYKDGMRRLADPGMKPNELWKGLLKQRAAGAVLFTHFSPRSVEVGLEPDLDMIAKVFTDLFIAAGTG